MNFTKINFGLLCIIVLHAQLVFSAVNVKDFGAKGDGVANDTPAIQKAINSLGKNGGEVFIPKGRYFLAPGGRVEVNTAGHKYMHYGVILPSNVTLRGDNESTVLIARKGTADYEDFSNGTLYSAIGVIRANNVQIKNLKIIYEKRDAQNKNAKYSSHAGAIDLRFSSNVTIRNCQIQFALQGITLFFGNKNVLIDTVNITNCRGCAIGMYSGSGRTLVSNSYIADCSDGTLTTYGNNGEVLFIGNRIEMTPNNQRKQKYTQLMAVEASSNVKVIGNHLEGGSPAIDIKRSKGSVVIGNTLVNCRSGIIVRAGDHAGAAGYSWRTLIANNSLADFPHSGGAGAFGIRLSTAVSGSVEGNILSNIDGFGIVVSGYGEYRKWPLGAKGISLANNIIIRRVEEHADDPATRASIKFHGATSLERWDPFIPSRRPPKGARLLATLAMDISDAKNISVTGNVVKGGGAATYAHAGAVRIKGCKNFTFSGNSIGGGNLGRGLLVEESVGVVTGNSIESGTEFALKLSDCDGVSVTGNQLDFRSQKGSAIELSGSAKSKSTSKPILKGCDNCAITGNVIKSDAMLVQDNCDSDTERCNLFTNNVGKTSLPQADAIRLQKNIEANNKFSFESKISK